MISDTLTIILVVMVGILFLVLLKKQSDSRLPPVAPLPVPVQQPMQQGIVLKKQDNFPYDGCHQEPKHYNFELNKPPTYVAKPSQPINERPAWVDFPTSCQSHPVPNIDLPMSGTGVGVPAFPDVNEFPAPFEKIPCAKCEDPKIEFNAVPSDVYSNDKGIVDFPYSGPKVSGLACDRPSGIGEPAFEKQNEFPAPY
jgi:hypothetical protein